MTRILLADDDDDTRELVALALRRHGHDVDQVADGAEAAARAASHSYAAIVLDFHMPHHTGDEVAAIVRAGERNRSVPILLLTASATAAEVARAVAAGVDACLHKPVRAPELLATLDRLLRDGTPDETAS